MIFCFFASSSAGASVKRLYRLRRAFVVGATSQESPGQILHWVREARLQTDLLRPDAVSIIIPTNSLSYSLTLTEWAALSRQLRQTPVFQESTRIVILADHGAVPRFLGSGMEPPLVAVFAEALGGPREVFGHPGTVNIALSGEADSHFYQGLEWVAVHDGMMRRVSRAHVVEAVYRRPITRTELPDLPPIAGEVARTLILGRELKAGPEEVLQMKRRLEALPNMELTADLFDIFTKPKSRQVRLWDWIHSRLYRWKRRFL